LVRYVQLGKESVFQTAVAGSVTLNAGCSDNPDNNVVTPKPVATVQETDYLIGPYTNQASIDEFYAKADNVGELLMALFGADSPAQQGGSAAYLHTFSIADVPPSYTVRKGVEIDEEILAGCLFSKLSVKFTAKDGVKVSASFYNTKLKTSGVIGSPSLSQLRAFPCMNLSAAAGNLTIATVDKRSLIYECQIDIERAIPYNNVFNLASREMSALKAGGVSVSGKLSAIFNSNTERDRVLAGTPFTLVVNIAGDLIADTYYYSLGFDLRNCVYLSGGSPAVKDADEPLVADMSFRAHYDASGSFGSCRAYLQNTRTTAY
jgi:hypothetical protein